MKTLYITDLDGTFLNNDAVVSQNSRQIINELTNDGLLFSVATARSLITALELLEGTKISAPVVLMSGVFVYDLKNNKAVKYFDVDKNTFNKIISIFTSYNKAPFVFLYNESDDSFTINFTDLKLAIHKEFYRQRKLIMGDKMFRVDTVSYNESNRPVFVSLCDLYEDLFPITKELDKLPDVGYSFYKDTYTKYWFLEVFNAQASKAKGLEIVKEYTHADRVIAFGDNLNDIPLFTAADKGYAVKNAVDELKEIANEIIDSNENNGVAEFIRKDFKK